MLQSGLCIPAFKASYKSVVHMLLRLVQILPCLLHTIPWGHKGNNLMLLLAPRTGRSPKDGIVGTWSTSSSQGFSCSDAYVLRILRAGSSKPIVHSTHLQPMLQHMALENTSSPRTETATATPTATCCYNDCDALGHRNGHTRSLPRDQ